MIRILLLIFCSSLLLQDNPHFSSRAPFSKLSGKWCGRDPEGFMFCEYWRVQDSVLSGEGYMPSAADTQSLEDIRILKRKAGMFYEVHFPGSSDKPLFEIIEQNDSRFLCRMEYNDFPQDIEYSFKGDSLIITLSGVLRDKPKRAVYRLRKSK